MSQVTAHSHSGVDAFESHFGPIHLSPANTSAPANWGKGLMVILGVLGLACIGATAAYGFTGGGEVKLASKASLALTERGVEIRVGSTEIGQGTRTMHAQIVADTLGIPYDQVEVSIADTATVPDSGPTVASRTCMIVGRLLQRCGEDMRKQLGPMTPAA